MEACNVLKSHSPHFWGISGLLFFFPLAPLQTQEVRLFLFSFCTGSSISYKSGKHQTSGSPPNQTEWLIRPSLRHLHGFGSLVRLIICN